MNRPRLRLRGRFVRQAATMTTLRRDMTLRPSHGSSVAAVAFGWRALAHEPGVRPVQVDPTVGAMSQKVK